MSASKKKLVIVDSNALMHRAFHALPPLTTSKGKMMNAVYGFVSIFLKMINDLKPDYIICAFDVAAPTFRKEKYDEYKAHRAKAPQEFYDQIPDIKRIIESFNIPILEKPGFEADDIIGTLSDKFSREKDLEVIILTGDLDTLQLVNGVSSVYTFKKGIADTVIYDHDAVVARYGLEPGDLADYKGLRGDPSDNIPGVPGIGEKTASKIIQKYHSLENLYDSIMNKKEEEIKKESENLIKGKVYQNLKEFKEQAFFSRELSTIRRDVPVEMNLALARWNNFEIEKVTALFKEFEFWSLVNRLREVTGKQPITKSMPAKKEMGFSIPVAFEEIKPSNLNSFALRLARQREFAFKILQQEDLFGAGKKIFCFAFGPAEGVKNFVFTGDMHPKIKEILEEKKIKKIGYDLKNDLKGVWDQDTIIEGAEFDVMIAAYLVLSGQRDYSLEKLVFSQTGKDIEINSKNTAGAIFLLKDVYAQKLAECGMEKLFKEVEMPLVGILAKMEKTGIRIDKEFLSKMSAEIEKRLAKLSMDIYDLAGEKFNINSPQQLTEILFNKLNIPTNGIAKTEKGKVRSTAASELAKLAGRYKIVDHIMEYRELAKLKNTYLDTLPLLVDPRDNRLHTTFNQTITVTGRLSSSDPNLQNIPVRTDLGNLVREAFIADEGYELVSFDYSQIELRLAASLAKDRGMIDIFKADGDIHTATSAAINRIKESEVTSEMRRRAKALNFGIIYGISVYGLAQSAGVSYEEAKNFIEGYMAKFSGVSRYITESIEEAKRKGYAETILGRRRYLPELRSPNSQVRQAAERMAVNMPIQGMAADVVKLAMIGVSPLLDGDVRLLLQVHDELLFEIKKEKISSLAPKIKSIMENVYSLEIPLKVDIKIGANWGKMEKLK